ncbi:hypothetical protein D918_05190 [Trichuris suis]|nr:hypothetical protein D918_05190 [Trichuris suis]
MHAYQSHTYVCYHMGFTIHDRPCSLTRIGPAPVTAVKEGRIDLVYDTACVIAEVNAEKCYWVESEVGEERLVKVDQNREICNFFSIE